MNRRLTLPRNQEWIPAMSALLDLLYGIVLLLLSPWFMVRSLTTGRYRTGLRDGDIVVAVAGTRTPTVAAMVAVAMQAAGNGATHLAGRIVRGDATLAVVLELPK